MNKITIRILNIPEGLKKRNLDMVHKQAMKVSNLNNFQIIIMV